MKIMKRLSAFLLTLCLLMPMYSIVGYAANGRVSFTDPKTKTGETVEVTCALRGEGQGLQSFEVRLQYDPESLSFTSGDEGVTKESDGVLTYSGTGNGENRIAFTMKFQALKVGTTKIEVTESKGVSAGGETLDCQNGNSTITIDQGTEPVATEQGGQQGAAATTDISVTVGKQSYQFSEGFKKSDIPSGFSEAMISFQGAEHKFVKQDDGEMVLGYLVNDQKRGEFFLFDTEKQSFSPFVQIAVSAQTSIVLLQADDQLKVPSGYEQVKLTVNEHEFPAWQNVSNTEFYLVYAMSDDGTKNFYQYDTVQDSYQRFIVKEEKVTELASTKLDKALAVVEKNFTMIALATMIAVVLVLIIIIVLAVKLRHRNLELDDLYDELDLDDEEYEDEEDFDEEDDFYEEKKPAKKSIFKKRHEEEEEDLTMLDEDDESDDFFDDEEDDFDDTFAGKYTDTLDDFVDDFEDDFEEERTMKKSKGLFKKKKSEDFFDDDDDDFDDDLDFIDLD